MKDVYEALLLYEELPPEQQQALRQQIEGDPKLATAFAQWRAVRSHLRETFRERLPARRLLVLYALEQEGHGDLLTSTERASLDGARDDLQRALDAHPALHDVVRQIQRERADFDAVWDEHAPAVASAGAASIDTPDAVDGAVGASTRADRAARKPRSQQERSQQGQWARRVAAMALVAIVAVFAVFLWPRSPEMTTVAVADGQTKSVELVDGTVVRLVGEAELAYENAADETFDRRVALNYGKAFFEVQELKSPTPFVVSTPTATATVLGTEFGVETGAERTDVVLATGKVQVDARDGSDAPVVLEPGQHSRVDRDAAPTVPKAVDLTAALKWTGLFVFRSTSVETLAERLSAHYDVAVTVDPALQGEGITGSFERTQPVDQILAAVASTLGARVEGSADDGYRLVAR